MKLTDLERQEKFTGEEPKKLKALVREVLTEVDEYREKDLGEVTKARNFVYGNEHDKADRVTFSWDNLNMRVARGMVDLAAHLVFDNELEVTVKADDLPDIDPSLASYLSKFALPLAVDLSSEQALAEIVGELKTHELDTYKRELEVVPLMKDAFRRALVDRACVIKDSVRHQPIGGQVLRADILTYGEEYFCERVRRWRDATWHLEECWISKAEFMAEHEWIVDKYIARGVVGSAKSFFDKYLNPDRSRADKRKKLEKNRILLRRLWVYDSCPADEVEEETEGLEDQAAEGLDDAAEAMECAHAGEPCPEGEPCVCECGECAGEAAETDEFAAGGEETSEYGAETDGYEPEEAGAGELQLKYPGGWKVIEIFEDEPLSCKPNPSADGRLPFHPIAPHPTEDHWAGKSWIYDKHDPIMAMNKLTSMMTLSVIRACKNWRITNKAAFQNPEVLDQDGSFEDLILKSNYTLEQAIHHGAPAEVSQSLFNGLTTLDQMLRQNSGIGGATMQMKGKDGEVIGGDTPLGPTFGHFLDDVKATMVSLFTNLCQRSTQYGNRLRSFSLAGESTRSVRFNPAIFRPLMEKDFELRFTVVASEADPEPQSHKERTEAIESGIRTSGMLAQALGLPIERTLAMSKPPGYMRMIREIKRAAIEARMNRQNSATPGEREKRAELNNKMAQAGLDSTEEALKALAKVNPQAFLAALDEGRIGKYLGVASGVAEPPMRALPMGAAPRPAGTAGPAGPAPGGPSLPMPRPANAAPGGQQTLSMPMVVH